LNNLFPFFSFLFFFFFHFFSGEFTNDDSNFVDLLLAFNKDPNPLSQQIVKAIGQSIEQNTFEKFAKVYFSENSTPFYSEVYFIIFFFLTRFFILKY